MNFNEQSCKANLPKCHFCAVCDGRGCLGEMPGMGGVFQNKNFIANCDAWRQYTTESLDMPALRLAPITGAVENVGWHDEKSFYEELLAACFEAGLALSIGDGCPDAKLLYGIETLRNLRAKAAVFIKPYPDEVFFKRLNWASDVAEIFGIDIDSYNIITMRQQVHLEKKTPEQLLKIKSHISRPFALKGVFTPSDLETVVAVKPDIVVISNHGGRVETIPGSTADFLAQHFKTLKNYCGEVWIDGGLRSSKDLQIAHSLGASTCMIARPIISALLQGGKDAVFTVCKNFGLSAPAPQKS